AEHIVAESLPYSTIITAPYCVDAGGNEGECDTGAPYNAGVLGTRAYLMSRAGRFNLTRASTMMLAFACSRYPMATDFEPRVDKTVLIKMFQAESLEEQTEAKATSGFGNGEQCYSCHGQFAPHAQLYVRFDETGKWRVEATGMQDTGPMAELGRAADGLYTSHFSDPLQAQNESSQMLGSQVDNLAGAAKVLAARPEFVACSARNLMEYVLAVDGATQVDDDVLLAIANAARAREPDPTFAAIVIETFTNSRVVRSIVPKEAAL
ncbi:MAG: hypothetical protein H7Z43_12430, partial [Clostridia bacterium]|nr:hypothetical protein [Deltaproteobacteria bacterium]